MALEAGQLLEELQCSLAKQEDKLAAFAQQQQEVSIYQRCVIFLYRDRVLSNQMVTTGISQNCGDNTVYFKDNH